MKTVLCLIVAFVMVLSGATQSFGQTTVAVAPETSSVVSGGTVTLSIMVNNVSNLYGARAVVSFDNSLICADTVARGSFLGSSGAQVFFSYDPPPSPTVNSIRVDQAILSVGGVSGSGVLFSITFTALGGGTSTVTLSSLDLRDSTNHNIPATALSGSVTVVTNSVTVNISPGWNMISNPVTASNDSVTHLFPTSMFGYAYAFNPGPGYVQQYTMANGVGYWEKFPASTAQTVAGFQRVRDSIDVLAGWNMIGTISNPVDTSTIVSEPAGLRASSWYGFGPSGYTAVTQLTPGKAYWVKSNGAGKFVMASPLVEAPAKVQGSGGMSLDQLNELTITDSRDGSQTLYFGPDAKKEIEVSLFDMPPPPPLGTLDARFETAAGGSMVRTHDAQVSGAVEFPVKIQTDSYPVTVTWKMKAGTAMYELTDGRAGQAFQAKEMTGEGSIKIITRDLSRITVRLVGDGTLPREFALAQNYPNPFNPSTTINYDLPIDTRVTLKVFNILGQEVATLVNEEQKAGYKLVDWNASNFASGVYFYRLDACSYTSLKKLLLLK